MRKIKSIKQLQNEKKRIKLRGEELENKIRGNWSELKECVKPAAIAKDTFSKVMRDESGNNVNGESVLKSTIRYGVFVLLDSGKVTLLAKKIADKAGMRFDKMFKKDK